MPTVTLYLSDRVAARLKQLEAAGVVTNRSQLFEEAVNEAAKGACFLDALQDMKAQHQEAVAEIDALIASELTTQLNLGQRRDRLVGFYARRHADYFSTRTGGQAPLADPAFASRTEAWLGSAAIRRDLKVLYPGAAIEAVAEELEGARLRQQAVSR